MGSSTKVETVHNSDDTLFTFLSSIVTAAGLLLLFSLPASNWDGFLATGWIRVIEHICFAGGTTLFGITFLYGGRKSFNKWWAKALMFLAVLIMSAGCFIAAIRNVTEMLG